jgi:hypothetical protein
MPTGMAAFGELFCGSLAALSLGIWGKMERRRASYRRNQGRV